MGKLKERLLVLLRSGPGTRLLLVLFAVLVIAIIFIGLHDTPGYVLGYLATAILFLVMVRGWRSIKSYVILALATFCIGVFLSALDVEVIMRIAVWNWGPAALYSPPMHIIDAIINYLVMFGGPVGLVFGFVGALVLGILRLVGLRKAEQAEGNT